MGTGSHNSRCENALRDGCRCTGCGGSQHGWQGSLGLVRIPAAERRRRREAYEGKLEREPGSHRLRDRQPVRSAVADLARLDVVDWLADPARHHTTPDRGRRASGEPPDDGGHDDPQFQPADQVAAVAKALTTDTWPGITRELGRVTSHERDVRRELANHGWCDLLVGMIRVIEAVRHPLKALAAAPPR